MYFLCLAVVTPTLGTSGLCQTTSDVINDVIVGRGHKGPYSLSWTDFDPATIQVIVNGMTLKRGEKYAVDPTKGMLSFTSTVLADTIVRVTYNITASSRRRSSGMSLPVSLDVFQGRDTNVRVTGLYAQDDPNNPDAGKTVVGLGGEKKWAGSALSTQIYMSQRSSQSAGSEGSAWDRAAFKLGSENTLGRVKFSGSILHSGSQFAGGTETGMGVGKRAGDFGVAFSANPNLTASARLLHSEDTTGATKGNQSSLLEQNVVASVTSDTKVALTHSLAETKTAAENSERAVDSTGIKLDTKLNADTTAAVTAGLSTTTGGGDNERVLTQGAQVQSKRGSGQVSLTQKESRNGGHEESYAVGGQIKPIDKVSLQAAVAATESSKAGATSKTDFAIQFDPDRKTQIQARMQTDAAPTTQQFQRDVNVVTKPLDFARFSASFSQKGANENDDVTKQAQLELTPFTHTQLSAGVKYAECGLSALTITDYAARTAPFRFVSLSGNIRQRQAAAGDACDSANMELALSPVSFLALTGGYQANPEDQNGQIQNYNATNVGIKAKVGSVGVTTCYATKNEYLSQRTSDEGNLGLELPGVAGGKLTTGVKVARQLDGSMLSWNTYQLGYVRDLGSALNFSLTGYYTRYLRDKVAMPDKTEYSAEASLGVKF